VVSQYVPDQGLVGVGAVKHPVIFHGHSQQGYIVVFTIL